MHPKLADSIHDVGPDHGLSASLQTPLSEHFDESIFILDKLLPMEEI
jgi:hypothetical protein